MNTREPLSSRGLRLRAIVLPGVVFLTVWLLNVGALRTHVGPQRAAFWMSVFVSATGVLVWWLWRMANESGVSPWRTASTTVAAALGWFIVSGALPELGREPPITVGNRGARPGGGFTLSVTDAFQRAELEALLMRAQEFKPSGAMDEFTCGDAVPDFMFEMTLRAAGEWNERLVNVGYTPRLDVVDDRCMSFGLSYMFDVALTEIDHGPPVDYGYVNPHTGKKLEPYVAGPPRKPICRCDLRSTGREWVAWSEQSAAELR